MCFIIYSYISDNVVFILLTQVIKKMAFSSDATTAKKLEWNTSLLLSNS